MKRLINNLRHKAILLELQNSMDEDDRPVQGWLPKRDILYQDLGITASEQYLSDQAKTSVVSRMRVRLDKSISRKDNRIRLGKNDYKITRIYLDEDEKMMELSLAYVD